VAWLADAHSQGVVQKPHKPRIAIVDMDVHHGNGTEAIVRNLTPHREFLPLPSSWAPTAYESYKPWLDETDQQDVLFSSIHLYAGTRSILYASKIGAKRCDTTTCSVPVSHLSRQVLSLLRCRVEQWQL